MIRLSQYFNKTLLVCIPFLFEDRQPRRFKLVGLEESGLWLESEELADPLQYPEEAKSPEKTVAAFVPFSHIAFVMPEVHPLTLLPRLPTRTDSAHHPVEKPAKSEAHEKHPRSHQKKKK